MGTQEDQAPVKLIGTTGLTLLVLSYLIAAPWLIRAEAVDLAPFLCALVFGCCLIKPVSTAFQRASTPVRGMAVLLILAIVAVVAFTIIGGYAKTVLAYLRDMPLWLVNHIAFLFFASLPLLKGVVVGGLNLISRAARTSRSS